MHFARFCINEWGRDQKYKNHEQSLTQTVIDSATGKEKKRSQSIRLGTWIGLYVHFNFDFWKKLSKMWSKDILREENTLYSFLSFRIRIRTVPVEDPQFKIGSEI